MPGFLDKAFGALSSGEAAVPGPNGTFSPVEQCRDLPAMMAEDDAAHRSEIEARARGAGRPGPTAAPTPPGSPAASRGR